MKIFLTLTFLIFLYSASYSAEMIKGDIYLHNVSIDVSFRLIELSGKIDGFYCKNGQVEIFIEGDDKNIVKIIVDRHDFNGSGNWIEGVAKRYGNFENFKLIDFNTFCFEE